MNETLNEDSAVKTEVMDLCGLIVDLIVQARREGLLSIDSVIENIEEQERPVFKTALQFVIDGVDGDIIRRYLQNHIESADDYTDNVKYAVMKEGLCSLQCGDHPRIAFALMDSVIPSEFRDENLMKNIMKKFDN